MTKAKVQVRRSPVDGKFRRWEYRSSLSLNLITSEQVEAGEAIDADVPVCTGVFKSRGAAFRK
jgi:hypothetical protein